MSVWTTAASAASSHTDVLWERASSGNLVLIKSPQRIAAWLELTLQLSTGEAQSLLRERQWETQTHGWVREGGLDPALVLLILPVRWSVCQRGLLSITIFPNMPKPSKVHPCAIYYSHLSASWEEAWSQLCLLFCMLSAVLSVSVKCVGLIEEEEEAGVGISPPTLILLSLQWSGFACRLERRTKKARRHFESSDRRVIMSGGRTKH